MRPKGTIYTASGSTSHGELRLALTEREKKRFKVARFIGANMSSFALAFVIFFYGPTFETSMDYQAGLAKAEAQMSEAADEKALARANRATQEFALSIPKIGANSSIVPDVDPFDINTYQDALKRGIAHAKNSGKPGDGRRIFLFAHSTNSPLNYSEYNAVFYQLRLLSEGEKIFINYNGDSHIYIVKQKEVVSATDTHWLTEAGSGEQLVLQTCDPPGTSLRRLLVIAEPVAATH